MIMKGTKVQTLGASAVAGAWCMHGWLIGNWAIIIMTVAWVQLLIRMRTANLCFAINTHALIYVLFITVCCTCLTLLTVYFY